MGRRLATEFHASVMDINFGCPSRDVAEKAESGSYLLRDPERVGRIVGRVAAACAPMPVTAKIRLGWTRDTINAIDVAQAVEASGGAAVTVHGRTVADRFRGRADWDEIARIKPHLQRIPAGGQRRPGDAAGGGRGVRPLRRRRRDDRPGGVGAGRGCLPRSRPPCPASRSRRSRPSRSRSNCSWTIIGWWSSNSARRRGRS